MEDVRSQLKAANEEIAALSTKVEDQDLELKARIGQIRSSSKKIVDLQRKVQELGKN